MERRQAAGNGQPAANGSLRPSTRHLLIALALAIQLFLGGCNVGEVAGEPITASGFIEGEEILIAPEVGGRIEAVWVDEGDQVAPGQELVVLDDALLQAWRGEAAAAVAAAEANLAHVLAGARPAELAAAQAALLQAEAQRDGARVALENIQQAVENPQDLELQIATAQAQVDLAEQNVEMAETDLNEAEVRYWAYAAQGGEVERTYALNVEAARAALEAAQAMLNGTRRYLYALYDMQDTPLTTLAELHGAEAELAAAEAGVEIAQANLEQTIAGPTEQQVALATAHLHQAWAALALVDAQITQLTLVSPGVGMIASRNAHVGETAAPGVTLLSIVNLDQVTLVIYIPENQIGQVQIGQPVQVTVDSFPDRVYTGQVTTIAGEAEFTPRNVQTQEERVNLVFAVQVTIPNPDHTLKPGMPADAIIQP
ncbi:MAG: efflux RND transporter periplasmic adaptor subunit [Anaerolineae bacterium]|nr:efflux RND transporter periplasmic adaptor subunit [Anaerolineae bacterium]